MAHKSVAAVARSGQVFASFGSLVGSDRDGVLTFAIRERGLDLLDQLTGGLRTQFDGDPLTPAGSLVDEIDAERMVQRGVGGMVEVDIGRVDAHPALRSLGAAVAQDRLHYDVGAHGDLLSARRMWRGR